jgi:uncharacterized damage-inducible protein DinB
MSDDFPSLYTFNRWANDKMLDACRRLTAEQFVAEPAPGWTPVRTTLWHVAIVSEGWLKAVSEIENVTFPAEAEVATPDDAAKILQRAYTIFDSLAPKFTAEFLGTPRTFSRRGRTVVLPPWVVLRHIVNHTTYHRGQVASKLKRFGIQQVETDLVYWAYEQIPQSKPN